MILLKASSTGDRSSEEAGRNIGSQPAAATSSRIRSGWCAPTFVHRHLAGLHGGGDDVVRLRTVVRSQGRRALLLPQIAAGRVGRTSMGTKSDARTRPRARLLSLRSSSCRPSCAPITPQTNIGGWSAELARVPSFRRRRPVPRIPTGRRGRRLRVAAGLATTTLVCSTLLAWPGGPKKTLHK